CCANSLSSYEDTSHNPLLQAPSLARGGVCRWGIGELGGLRPLGDDAGFNPSVNFRFDPCDATGGDADGLWKFAGFLETPQLTFAERNALFRAKVGICD